jgi:hypothetical protein
MVLAVTSCRGFIEQDAATAADFWFQVHDWFSRLEIDAELEPAERGLLGRSLGSLAHQEWVDAAWSCEAMTVLAWALGCIAMPPYDKAIVAGDVANALGFLKPQPETVLATASLRPLAEIHALREQIFAVHWRLNEFRLTGQRIHFPTVAQNAWFGPMSLGACRLIDDDLAIGDARIDKADPARFQQCVGITRERHRAANWLCGESEVFSEVDAST